MPSQNSNYGHFADKQLNPKELDAQVALVNENLDAPQLNENIDDVITAVREARDNFAANAEGMIDRLIDLKAKREADAKAEADRVADEEKAAAEKVEADKKAAEDKPAE